VIKELEQPIITGAMQHKIGAGVGIALLPQDGRNGAEILGKADIALYRAKEEEPQSASRFFDAEMDARIRERDLIERDLRVAIQNGAVQPLSAANRPEDEASRWIRGTSTVDTSDTRESPSGTFHSNCRK
jgi:predicted signal transduction protein with EAL and GGDEF domain